MVSRSSCLTASIMQVDMCSLRITRLTDLMADSIAESWISTSDYTAHSVQYCLCMLCGMDMTVFMVMRSAAMYMCMSEFVSVLVYMSMFMKMFMLMSVTVFVII